MKQPSHSGAAPIGGLRLAFVAVVVCGLFVALVIFLPDIRGSLRNTLPQEQSSSRDAAVGTLAEADLSGSAMGSAAAPRVASENPTRQVVVSWVKTVRVLPVTNFELAAAHDQASGEACEPVPGGEAREITSFAPYLTQRDYREFSDGRVTAVSSRQHIFSVGFDMLDSDRSRLPHMSGGAIARYLNGQFVTLQVRIQKDLISQALHLHHRPLAAVASFQQRRLTQDPTEALARSLRNYRSLGLFLADGMPATNENLRTLVLLHKSEREAVGGSSETTGKYEFVFVRALDDSVSARLRCHTFATSDDRTVLHYLQSCEDPPRPDSCSIKTMLHFTEYADHGLRPVASVSRGSIFNDQAKYSMDSLNRYAQSQGWAGGAFDNLTKTLDALIDRKVPSQQ